MFRVERVVGRREVDDDDDDDGGAAEGSSVLLFGREGAKETEGLSAERETEVRGCILMLAGSCWRF